MVQHWSRPTRFAFRFFFLYFICFLLQMPSLWRGIVSWTAATIFHVKVTEVTNGSGDTTFNWVQIFCFAAVSLTGAFLWTAIDRKSTSHERLHGILRAAVRYVLGLALMSYGMAKIIKTQFPMLEQRLTDTYGDSSPMGLLWTFMGYSTLYNLFAGLAEFVPGVLLFYRRTATLGALLGAAAMANVVALNFSYDVPVKILSSTLLLFCGFVALPDARRLWDFFIGHAKVAPADLRAAFHNKPRLVFWWQVVKSVMLVALLGAQTWFGLQAYNNFGEGSQRPRLGGHYTALEGRYFVAGGDRIRIQDAEGKSTWKSFKVSDDKVETNAFDSGFKEYAWKEENGLLILTGPSTHTLKRRTDFPLLSRGFHWINERPFNR